MRNINEHQSKKTATGHMGNTLWVNKKDRNLKTSKIIFSIIGITLIGFALLLSKTIFSPEISNYFNRIEFDSEKWKTW